MKYSLSLYEIQCKLENINQLLNSCLNAYSYIYKTSSTKHYMSYENVDKNLPKQIFCTIDYGDFGSVGKIKNTNTNQISARIKKDDSKVNMLPFFYFTIFDKHYLILGQYSFFSCKLGIEKHLQEVSKSNAVNIVPVIDDRLIKKLNEADSIEDLKLTTYTYPMDKKDRNKNDFINSQNVKKTQIIISGKKNKNIFSLKNDTTIEDLKRNLSNIACVKYSSVEFQANEISVTIKSKGKRQTLYLERSKDEGYKEVKKISIEESEEKIMAELLKEECIKYSKEIKENYL